MSERVRSKASGRYLPDVAEPEPTDSAIMAETMAEVADVLRAVAEAANGYRLTLKDQGWSEYIIEQAAGSALITLQAKVLR